MLLFWRGWPSQWHPSPFAVDGVSYGCAEQYMMAEKARLFGDDGALHSILAAATPKEQKALGRRVAGFDRLRWDQACREIVYLGNLAKFTQNTELSALLQG